jgi:DNA-binding response OmpR family regulator
MAKILIVDDDQDLVEILRFALTRAGYEVVAAHDSPTAIQHLEESQPDIAILDVNIGQWDGFELLRDLRQQSQIPVILLSARGAEEDKVRGLQLGADDYISKPFGHSELLARVVAQLRRAGQSAPMGAAAANNHLRVGPLALNRAEHSASLNGKPIALTVTEFRLLQYLMVNAGRVVPPSDLSKHVWGYDGAGTNETARVAVHRLRRKLDAAGEQAKLLRTVPGVGIMLKAEEEEPSAHP